MTFVQLVKHRLQPAISGSVLDASTAAPAAGIRVQITSKPAAFQAILDALATQYGSSWAASSRRPDVALTGLDGAFCFGDLPDGNYTLTFTLPHGDARYGSSTAPVTVSHAGDGAVTTPFVAATLPPTAVQGLVLKEIPPNGGQPPTTAPLRLALVRVRGTMVSGFSDSTGTYYVTGVDPGAQILVISAPGYTTETAAVTVQTGVVVAPSTVTLIPAS